MRMAARSLFKSLRDPRALVFGFSVFLFWWICVRAPEWNDYRLVFMAGALHVASILLLLKRVWSSFVAAVLGGYLPVQLAYAFWMLPRQAEVRFFSRRHFTYFAGGIVEAGGTVFLFLALSAVVLACSAQTLRRLASR